MFNTKHEYCLVALLCSPGPWRSSWGPGLNLVFSAMYVLLVLCLSYSSPDPWRSSWGSGLNLVVSVNCRQGMLCLCYVCCTSVMYVVLCNVGCWKCCRSRNNTWRSLVVVERQVPNLLKFVAPLESALLFLFLLLVHTCVYVIVVKVHFRA